MSNQNEVLQMFPPKRERCTCAANHKCLLSIDLGEHTGYAVYDIEDKKLLASGTYHVKGKTEAEKINDFHEFVGQITYAYNVDAIIAEAPYVRFAKAAAMLYGYKAVLMLYDMMLHDDVEFVGATELKKFATGNGRASKEDMIEFANSYWYEERREQGRELCDDNEADALCLAAFWVEREYTPEPLKKVKKAKLKMKRSRK